jgi:hypothetical protein
MYETLLYFFFDFKCMRGDIGRSTNCTKVRAIHRLYTTLHKTILGFADIGSLKAFFSFFFCITPHTLKIKKKVQESFIHLKTY